MTDQSSDRPSGPRHEPDEIAALLRLAGRRSPVPRERADRVRAVTRARWREQVRRRRGGPYRWTVAVAAAAAVLVVAVLRLLPPGAVGPPAASGPSRVEAVAGPAWTLPAAEPPGSPERQVGMGDWIPAAAALGTREDGRVALRLPSGHSLRLDRSTRVRLQADGSVTLEAGAVYVDSGFRSTVAAPLPVHTPFGVVEEIGTQFEVRVTTDAVQVSLREGAAVVRRGSEAFAVAAGERLALSREGSVTRRDIPSYGPDWAWVAGVTPALEVGRPTAQVLLEWAARERGWTLAFADAAVARLAHQAVITGDLRGLTVEEALEAALPTSRMTYTVTDGMLLVSKGAGGGTGS